MNPLFLSEQTHWSILTKIKLDFRLVEKLENEFFADYNKFEI